MINSTPSFWQRLKHWWHARFSAPSAPTITEKDGVWIEQQDAHHYRLGLASDALEQIGDISFADLPILVDDELVAQDDILEVESDKAVENFKTPYAGTVVKTNDALVADPSAITPKNQAANWILVLKVD
ncbi:glycine cleavage system protein H [Levilactobacillus suantsaii]|uniref:Glycine cleavage system protein H n=1 Tax=Levilactobacillus suantsaii TaxID=2292255 RepID=A0A4Q0VJX5_9LACO|nr:glycine cleavage system protein H [Levilactobacillus suantsaii]QMU08229.1 glycine cleavage system protein H [Levilactobacillus suantsaii]RXI79138.1 glycine cleavage system protein H [Levilactobacillus suantsaii]